jgi:hypothetical protein
MLFFSLFINCYYNILNIYFSFKHIITTVCALVVIVVDFKPLLIISCEEAIQLQNTIVILFDLSAITYSG